MEASKRLNFASCGSSWLTIVSDWQISLGCHRWRYINWGNKKNEHKAARARVGIRHGDHHLTEVKGYLAGPVVDEAGSRGRPLGRLSSPHGLLKTG
jgi:hypothetical protein